jgi:antirestriction protein ArdC
MSKTYRRSASAAPAQSPAARITAEIIARLEAGTKPWVQPWRGAPVSRPLRSCGVPYRGMNVFWLWMVADMCGYASPYWMTFQQAKVLGGQVRKGEKSTIAIFYKSYTKEVDGADSGGTTEESRRVLKAYAVFNADQVEGLSAHFHPQATLSVVEPEGRCEDLDRFFGAVPAALRHHGDAAYYEPKVDRITMPSSELFNDFDHYYATLAHEVCNIASVLVSRIAISIERLLSPAARVGADLFSLQSRHVCFAAFGRES